MGEVVAVVLAAGSGQRLGADLPKQFLPLQDRPMLAWSLSAFQSFPGVGSVVVALPASEGAAELSMDEFSKVTARVAGGTTRQASLARALKAVPSGVATVLVHDAARPLLDQQLIGHLLEAFDEGCDGVIPAVPLEDTVKRVSEDRWVMEQIDRRGIWRVQTPQCFRRSALEDSLAKAMASGLESTDCSQMVTAAGYRVKVIEGDPLNFKVTRAADLWLAERVVAARQGKR